MYKNKHMYGSSKKINYNRWIKYHKQETFVQIALTYDF